MFVTNSKKIVNRARNFVSENKSLCIGMASLAATSFLDCYVTATSITIPQDEGNPVARYLYENLGAPGLYLVKAALIPVAIHAKKYNTSKLLVGASAGNIIAALSWYILKD